MKEIERKVPMVGMRYHTGRTVWEAALSRMRYIFDEFPTVVVATSGGKDSTVCLNLALIVAREKNRLPLKVMFLDQEVEYPSTVERIRADMRNPEVEPYWLQVPFNLGNGASLNNPWFHVWEPGAEWLRPKEPKSLTENVYGTDRFYALFDKFHAVHWAGEKIARIGGVRAEESPNRRLAMTQAATYKWITWGKREYKTGPAAEHYLFYPIYDWSYMDVWKAIHDNGWGYNRLYDLQYQHGIPTHKMRVSSLIHENAIGCLMYLQEVDPLFYAKLVRRCPGVSSANHLQGKGAAEGATLPPMFRDWLDYREHLLDNLIDDPVWREKYRKLFTAFEHGMRGAGEEVNQGTIMAEVGCLLSGDYFGVKLDAYRVGLFAKRKRAGK